MGVRAPRGYPFRFWRFEFARRVARKRRGRGRVRMSTRTADFKVTFVFTTGKKAAAAERKHSTFRLIIFDLSCAVLDGSVDFERGQG